MQLVRTRLGNDVKLPAHATAIFRAEDILVDRKFLYGIRDHLLGSRVLVASGSLLSTPSMLKLFSRPRRPPTEPPVPKVPPSAAVVPGKKIARFRTERLAAVATGISDTGTPSKEPDNWELSVCTYSPASTRICTAEALSVRATLTSGDSRGPHLYLGAVVGSKTSRLSCQLV